ncbi:Smg-4/UPF3 family-domain-containing protein [Mycena albidolilacea]|uniref:Smg-4/UPF3 family-domain-containing protein n=1 Tax=Mycena albidolilacea TaxID=1033008 RepID=A0AAD7ASQ6_9AGAR|nr:Smg-4/UPF3 family-domain-containing protein [Mycena albidolilacea]
MSAPKVPPIKPKKDRDREKKDKERLSQPPTTERLKTVVRRLPPNLPEDIFWQSVHSWVSDETVTWKAFYPGKLRKRLNKENISSRAYIAFKTEEQLAQFSREYDGHLFRDKAGNESYAVVEFAPYQKIPPEKKKVDARSGTLEKDDDYISFLESLNAEPSGAEPVSLESLIAANRAPSPPKTTPLLEALKAEKALQKEKESAIRQIAQQKKKANAAAAPAASTSGAPLSKKAAKKAAAAAAAAASASAQGQAPKPGAAGPSKSGPANAPNASATSPRPAKPPKTIRQPPRVPGPPAVPTDVSVASAGTTTTGDAAAPPRRTRPVIGLASRQFEAALSGAGVAPGAGSGAGAERKSRRERERERAAAAAAAGAGAEDATGPASAGAGPRKDKAPRRKDSVSGGVTVSPASGSGAEVRVPSILQRADPVVAPVVVHRIDGDVTVQPQAGVIPVNFATTAGPPRGGGGRGGRGGRGGGRARGGVVGGGVPVSRGGG